MLVCYGFELLNHILKLMVLIVQPYFKLLVLIVKPYFKVYGFDLLNHILSLCF